MSAPFVATALDLFGPITVRDVAKSRRRIKVWGVLYSCLSSKAVAILPCPGYDAQSFIDTHIQFTSVYGDPSKIFSNHGSNLIAGADVDWGRVRLELGRKGSVWTHTAKGCPWQNAPSV